MQAAKMFTKNSSFVKMSARRPHRRKSEIHRSVHAVYKSPPHIFSERNKLLNEGFARLYWTIRELQFRLFFRNEDMESNSMEELARIEPPEKPPTLEQLDELTGGRFSARWLKYMYNRFKNECPNGRMRFVEFKRLFGTFMPDRMNDGYLERMFNAFCQQQNSSLLLQSTDQLTFKDLVICLSKLCDENPASNADWTMRLIIGREGQINYQEFLNYVKSVFNFRGKSEQLEQQKKRAGSMALLGGAGGSPPPSAGPILEEKEHQQKMGGTFFPRPSPIVRSAAILASAITTPTAAPAIANFVPFVGHPKRGSSSPDQEAIRAICQRASFLFKELDSDQKGYLTSGDFERFFRIREQQRALVYAS